MIEAKIICDSIANEVRITTMQLTYPRFIHSEFMTHRVFSRNASSSRAIPVAKMIEQVTNNPAMPIHWGKNQPGMQASVENNTLVEYEGYADIIPDDSTLCGWDRRWGLYRPEEAWIDAGRYQARVAQGYKDAGYHKQVVNRILEPFQHIHVIVTATEWENFFFLRDSEAAQPEIRELARVMRKAMDESKPQELGAGDWHLPYIHESEITMAQVGDSDPYCLNLDDLIKCSIARCARVSYLNHDQTKPDVEKDIVLADKLISMKHMSPTEHQATPSEWLDRSCPDFWPDGITHQDRDGNLWSGNFRGWIQYRQMESMK